MAEIANTLGTSECSNEGANGSLQAFDCALGSFAQQCLQGMEHELYWVELGRIRRQIPKFCPASLDRLLDACDLVEGDIVEDDDVPTPERGDQTLLDVSEERFSVHGSLDHHRGDDTSLAKAGDECQCFPVSHRNIADQTLSTWAPTAEANHVGGDGSFVDKYKASGIKRPLLAHPASARPNRVGSLSLLRPQTFF